MNSSPLLRILLLSLLLAASACTPAVQATPTPVPPPTLGPVLIATLPPTLVPTPAPAACLTQPGSLVSGSLDTVKPPQEFLVYLPPCYAEQTDERYPVLYLLHGQLQTDDFWPVHLGASAVADDLIHSGQAGPFIMVFPDDRYWNLPPESGFGDRVLNLIIPYIDSNFRTLADRGHRALGGLSLGGGWALHLGFTRYDLFGAVGLHSPAIRTDDNPYLERYIQAIPSDAWPRLWIDAGDRDKDLGSISNLENMLTGYNIAHEWHMFSGDHSEDYWRLHTPVYLQWYVADWKAADPTPKP